MIRTLVASVLAGLAASLWLVLKDGDFGTTVPRFVALLTVASGGIAAAAIPMQYLTRVRPRLRIAGWALIGGAGGWLMSGDNPGPVPLAFLALGALIGAILVRAEKAEQHP